MDTNLFVPEDEEEEMVGLQGSPSPPPAQRLYESVEAEAKAVGARYEDASPPATNFTALMTYPVKYVDPAPAEEPHAAPRSLSLSVPLRFQQEILQEMVADDGLLVLGRGLGLESITSNLIHILSPPLAKGPASKRSLVIVLNAFKDENQKIAEDLEDLSFADFEDDDERPFIVLGGGVTTTLKKRRELYQNGGIISISSQVFLVDLLSLNVDPQSITGMVLLHAERCSLDLNESFIVNLYRKQNSWGFLKALTDQPELLARGFQPLLTRLRTLHLSKAFLWPRFHVEVSLSLKVNLERKDISLEQRRRGTLTEVKVKMTESMRRIQIAIIACMDALIAELRRQCPTLVSDYWDRANALDPGFASRVRLQLNPHWHRLTFTAKQVCSDLITLTDLLDSLLNSSAVAFYRQIQELVQANIKTASRPNATPSPWLEFEAADTVTSYATKRVFETTRDRYTGMVDGYLLEELPKWEQLAILLEDITLERASDGRDAGPTLILCSGEYVARQLQAYLATVAQVSVDAHGNKVFSGRAFMVEQLKRHFLVGGESPEAPDSEGRAPPIEISEGPPLEVLQVSKSFSKTAPYSKRRRTRGGSAVATVERLHTSTAIKEGERVVTAEVIRQLEAAAKADKRAESEAQALAEARATTQSTGGLFFLTPERFTSDSEAQYVEAFLEVERPHQIIVQRYHNRTDDVILQELMPSYIICYEPDLAFLRRIEVYQAINLHRPARLFFMYYQDSVDEQKHLAKIKKEKDAFTTLIRERATMAQSFVPLGEGGKVRKEQVLNTRIAGGSSFRVPLDELRVIVDTREFKSALPNFLNRAGIRVIPRMLTVGDYIISPKICLERKSIPDLIQSMASGRLYDQCKHMARYYPCPVLLIEFDENKSFSLEPFADQRLVRESRLPNEASVRYSKEDIQVKLVTLLVAYPKLKIIWSSSPLQTAEIVLRLKANQAEPDPQTALGMGVDVTIRTDDGPPQLNDQAIDLLRTIPGVTAANLSVLVNGVKSLRDLVTMEHETLVGLVGKGAAAKMERFFAQSR